MKKTRFITKTAAIAGLYIVLTVLNAGFSSGPVQCRLSEALCILPVFTAAAVPGVTIGCLVSNIIVGGAVWDIVFGSLATLIGAVGTYLLRKHKFFAFLPPIAANTVIVPIFGDYRPYRDFSFRKRRFCFIKRSKHKIVHNYYQTKRAFISPLFYSR